jgi:hypothetical protein
LAVSYCIASQIGSLASCPAVAFQRPAFPSLHFAILHCTALHCTALVQQKPCPALLCSAPLLLCSTLLSASLRPGWVRRYATLPPTHFPTTRPPFPSSKGKNRERAFSFSSSSFSSTTPLREHTHHQHQSSFLPPPVSQYHAIGVYRRIDDTVRTRRHCIGFVFLVTATSHSPTRRLHVSAARLDERVDRTV